MAGMRLEKMAMERVTLPITKSDNVSKVIM
jgi:hypothetical protein